MVTFEICDGNPGALQFLVYAYDLNMFQAEQGCRPGGGSYLLRKERRI